MKGCGFVFDVHHDSFFSRQAKTLNTKTLINPQTSNPSPCARDSQGGWVNELLVPHTDPL